MSLNYYLDRLDNRANDEEILLFEEIAILLLDRLVQKLDNINDTLNDLNNKER